MNIKELLDGKDYEIIIRPIDKEIIQENNIIIKIPFHLRGEMKVLEEAKKDRIIAGYASVIEVDQEEQLIPKETLKDGIETLLSNSEYANLMLVHQNIQIGQIISEWGELITHVDEKGLFIVAKIRTDLRTANEIWDKILEHELNGFSIAAEVLLDHEECDNNKCITVIDKINIFEVSVCTKPVNAKSGFIVISKSKDNDVNISEEDVCEDCSIKGITNMEKEEISKELPEEPKEVEDATTEVEETEEAQEESPTIEDTLEALTREIEALKGVVEELKGAKEEPEEEPVVEEPEVPEEEKQEPEEDDPIEDTPEGTEEEPEEEKAPEPEPELEPEPVEEKEEEPVEYPYPSKKDFDDLKKSVEDLISKFSNKSKDEKIDTLIKRVEIIEKSEMDRKAIVETDDETEEEQERFDLIRDPVRTGVLYRDM